ncbi:UHRF1-binding protein 1-like [Belonocnema kinseyi]|uniref:UHRF1-binding protein 1-like n=1 Tax=Belonocnema kinseyi TaxID=2817044 RepID=UPI00143D37AC|nr:UHRF1-binding protein 1-like [Belonocnema kinseyi]
MVSIIKNQLLKHLSRFTKNLSADKINFSTFKGEGELTNLELDEIVLTDLLELPSWLRLTSAWCNKVTFRIQWTKLKSVPIFLSLDEVHIEVETVEDLRSMSTPQGLSSYAGPAKYSFIHKVIDGITVAVNTVSVTFKSPAFIASVQMTRIMVESKSPTWQRCDLRMTRVKDPDRGQLLIFKELEWQTVRIEARSTKDKDLTPLRLLTNQARCRITIKKRLCDCFVMGSRLVIILDDLLWVLTDSQLKAALHFIDSLGGLIEKATILERKTKAARKLEGLPEHQAQVSQQTRSKSASHTPISKIFTRYDVVETSYHFLSQRIDLHLCDDPGAGRSLHPDLMDGGALQISLVKFQIDYYPYHLAIADRKHWALYKESSTPHSQWLQQSLNAFRGKFMDLIDSGRTQHSPLTRTQGNASESSAKSSGDESDKPSLQSSGSQDRKPSTQPSGNPVKNHVLEQLAKLMTTCIVIRIDDFTLYKVTTSTRKPTPKEFVSGDKDRFCLPEDVNILHAEFTYYYYPGDITFPLPPPKFYVQLNPIQVNFDTCSCLWFNSFLLNLYHSLLGNGNKTSSNTANLMYFDVKIEAILPRTLSIDFSLCVSGVSSTTSLASSTAVALIELSTAKLASLLIDTVSLLPSSGDGLSAESREVIKLLNPFFIDDKPTLKLFGIKGEFKTSAFILSGRFLISLLSLSCLLVPFCWKVTTGCVTLMFPKSIESIEETSLCGVSTSLLVFILFVLKSTRAAVALICQREEFPKSMSAILEESGTTDSRSPPEFSLPGVCEGIMKVTSTWGIRAPMTIEPPDSTLRILFESTANKTVNIGGSRIIVFGRIFALHVNPECQGKGIEKWDRLVLSDGSCPEKIPPNWLEIATPDTKFSSRSRGWVELPSDSECRAKIKLRLDHTLKDREDSKRLSQASQSTCSKRSSQDRGRFYDESNLVGINVHDKEEVMALFKDNMEIKLANVPLTLSMSSVTGLTDLVEDEIIPKPIPMEILLENITLTLNEDRPPNNITSPGPIPIDLKISRLRISRGLDGVFHIEPVVNALPESNSNPTISNSIQTKSASELNTLRQSCQQLNSDNEELKRRLAALERLSEENSRLRFIKEESDMLRSCLETAQENISILLKEKKSLQEAVTNLQGQLAGAGPSSSTRTSWSIKR